MSMHKLTAGSGYDYLTRQVAALDSTEKGHTGLAGYYAERGEKPEVWIGAGMAGIHGLKVAFGQVRSRELLQSQLGQRVHTGAEQRLHLLRGHRVTGVEAVDPGYPRTDPHPGLFTAFGVVGGQAGVALLGRIQRRDLPGQ